MVDNAEFELVVSDQLFSVVLVAYKWFKIQRHLPSCSVNVTSEYLYSNELVNIIEWEIPGGKDLADRSRDKFAILTRFYLWGQLVVPAS